MNNIQRLAFIKFLLWFLSLVLLVFIGITNVFAEEVNVGYVTNNTEVLMDIPSSGAGAPINLPVNTANSYGNIFQLWINVSNLSITPDYIYQLELRTPNASLTNITTLQILANNGQICNPLGFTDLTNGYPKIYFSCKAAASYISIYLYNNTGSTSPITTAQNFRWNYAYLRYFTEDDDIDLGPVISNQQQNTQQIIDNQNQLLGSKCSNLFNSDSLVAGDITGGYTNIRISSRQNLYLQPGTYYFKTNLPSTYNYYLQVNSIGVPPLSSYPSSYIYASNWQTSSTRSFTISTAGYFDLGVRKSDNSNVSLSDVKNYEFMLSNTNSTYCKYGSYTSKLDDVTGAIGDVSSALTDDSPISLDQISSTAGWLPAGPIDSIINLPLNFFNGLLTALNGTCQPLHVPIPYLDNKYMDIPCISTIFNQIEGLPNFWNWVGAICSVVILYRYLLALYKYYDDLTTLKANFISDFGGAP